MIKMDNIITVDTETYPDGDPFCISFTNIKLKQIYRRWNRGTVPYEITSMLRDEKIAKVFHKATHDIKVLRQIGVEVKGKIHDTLLMAQIGLPRQKRYGLKDLMMSEELPFNKPCKEYLEVKAYVKRGYSYDKMPGKLMKKYNLNDTYYTMLLYAYLEEVIKDPIYKLERKLIRTVVDMESNGIKIDILFTKEKLAWYEERLAKISRHFKKKYDLENLNSPQQVSELLYDRLELEPPVKRGKTHSSTDYLALIQLKELHPCVQLIIDHRRLATKVKMFLKPFLTKNIDGIIHPSFNQMGDEGKGRIKTGRFSSSKPNFQNIERGEDIRELVIPRKGYYFLDYDYDQIEMRLYAFLARDIEMKKIYYEGKDLHIIHKKMFVDPYRRDYDGQNRQIAKNIGFEIIYGIGAPGMTNFLHRQEIHLSIDVVRQMLDKWHKQHPSLTEFRRKLYRQHRGGFLEDMYGRRYFLPLAKNYMAVNYIIQGMSANIIKSVMPKVNKYVKGLTGKLVLTIHDELVIELPLKYYKSKEEKDIQKIMESPSKKIGIPLKVEFHRMKSSWGQKELRKQKRFSSQYDAVGK